MSQSRPFWQTLSLPVYIALALLIIIFCGFMYAFVSYVPPETDDIPETLDTGAYMETVSSLLENANPENAPMLLIEYQCNTCHETQTDIAPQFDGIAERAATRRPPLSAAAYIYESIIHPNEFTVDGYIAMMPQNYPDRISQQELGDIIAYLLTR